MATTIYNKISERLSSLNPIALQIIDETYKHSNHLEDGATETHFKLSIVSERFKGLSRIERHKLIYQLLAVEMKNNIHALVIKALTLEERTEL